MAFRPGAAAWAAAAWAAAAWAVAARAAGGAADGGTGDGTIRPGWLTASGGYTVGALAEMTWVLLRPVSLAW
jgi:hypothetical protein